MKIHCVKTRALDPPQQRGQLHNSKCWKNHKLTVQKLIVLSEKNEGIDFPIVACKSHLVRAAVVV